MQAWWFPAVASALIVPSSRSVGWAGALQAARK